MYKTITKSWRDRLAEIQAVKKEYADHFSIMNPYQRLTFQREISNLMQQHSPYIKGGVLEEHERALNNFSYAHKRVKREKQKEIAGWDAQKLSAEIQVYNQLTDQAIKTDPGPGDFRTSGGDRIQKIYQEAWESGDKYKQRAACEVMISALSKAGNMDQSDRMSVNRLAQQAKTDIEKTRTTPELTKAYEDAEKAWSQYRVARQEVIRTSEAVGEGDPLHPYSQGPFTQAVRRVQVIDGEIVIYDANAPEVIRGYNPVKEVESEK
jgi:hypothetical protein